MLRKIFYRTSALLMLCGLSSLAQAAPATLTVDNAQDALTSGGEHTVYLKIGITPPAQQVAINKRQPLNLALVIDRSGSMSGDRIANAKRAAARLVELLSPGDTFSLVAYSDNAQVLFPASKTTNKPAALAAINGLTASGMTALYAGVEAGAQQVAKNRSDKMVNRVVLLSDGEANVGPSSSTDLAALGRKLGGQNMSVTTVGLGLGYNSDLMTRLASASDGNHVFVENALALENIFRREFLDASTVVARNAEINIRYAPGVKPVRVYGYDGKISGNTVSAKIPQLQAGEEKYIIVEAKLDAAAKTGNMPVADVSMSYDQLADGRKVSETGQSSVRLVSDSAEAQKTVNAPVMEKVVLQTATQKNEEALAAIQAGDKAKGAAMLKENKAMLQQGATMYRSSSLRDASAKQDAYEAQLEQNALPELEKQMNQDVYNQKRQKAYK